MPEPTKLKRGIERALLASLGSAVLTAAASGSLAIPSGDALAATIAVDAGAVDDDNSSGNCSLVEAVRAANTDSAVDACTAGDGADTLVLPPDSMFTFEEANDGASALPLISSELTVQGNGAVIERSDAGGTPYFRLLHVGGSGMVNMTAVTLQNGLLSSSGPAGGALLNEGSLELNEVTISDNVAIDGAGIHNAGSLELNRSSLTDHWGGAALHNESGTAIVNESAIYANFGHGGGGINNNASLVLNQSTVSGNVSNGSGGGIKTSGSLTLNHSTVTSNWADYKATKVFPGGGIDASGSSSLTLNHSIISGNSGASFGGQDIHTNGTVNADSFNLFGSDSVTTSSSISGFAPGPTDLTATSDGTHPTPFGDICGFLANNGGPTLTRALVAGSPAIDAGDPGFTPPPDHDQRGPGFARVVGTAVDIGAYEYDPRLFADRFEQ